jgi:imidazolonepropionase-like amidohydrolase
MYESVDRLLGLYESGAQTRRDLLRGIVALGAAGAAAGREASSRNSPVFQAGTARTSNSFGLTDRGRIAAGFKADMVLVRGDPTSDITATRDILRVWRSGIEVDRRLARP